ncbi:uncharacterized protein LOC125191751 isoform X2 [Salvia hispanica]|nr:uncharacterized protein LOC125191751 isoform X2 [Salvia hispanica]
MATEEEDDENFTSQETNILTIAYIHVSENTIIDDSHGVFWFLVYTEFREMKPDGSPARDSDQLQNQWARVHKDVSKFTAIYASCRNKLGRRYAHLYIRQQAKEAFESSEGRMFEYEDVWEMLRIDNKLCCDSEAACSGSKRTKVSASEEETASRAA